MPCRVRHRVQEALVEVHHAVLDWFGLRGHGEHGTAPTDAPYRHLEGSLRLLAGGRGRSLSGEFERLMSQSDPMTQNSLPAGSRSTRVVHSPASVRDTDEAPATSISSTRGRA